VRDGEVWTSAGVTAGMDLALAFVAEDRGQDVALRIARHLVMYVQRPGGQAQFSTALRAQQATRAPLRSVQAWAAEHLAEDLSVARLAERAAMSPRHFARTFATETGLTPARFVAELRVDAARRLLEAGGLGIETIAARCGFGTGESMRRAFLRTVQLAPRDYRRQFSRESA
jgi:transcriptional regulator GlxA family with amidase domain